MWIPKAQIFFHSTLLWCIFCRIEISTFSIHRVRVSFLFCSSVLLLFCFQVLFLAVFSFTMCRWLKEVFLSADKSGDGLLSVDEVFSLMHKLNVKISNRKLRETFKVCVCVFQSFLLPDDLILQWKYCLYFWLWFT